MNLLSTAQAARILGVHIRTVSRFVAAGRLTPAAQAPGVRGAFLIDPAEVDRFAETRNKATA